MKPSGRIVLKVLEFISCVVCISMKIYTDLEARQIFFINQKLSREWGLLQNVTWSSAGSSFANITYGGYTLITALMMITRCIDNRSRPTIMEKIFLILGVIMFFAMAGLVFAALDQLPHGLIDNAIVLGCLSLFVGFLFLIDLSDPLQTHSTEQTQTDNVEIIENTHAKHFSKHTTTHEMVNLPNGRIHEDMKKEIHIETQVLPSRQTPVFAKVNSGPEKRILTQDDFQESQIKNNQMVYYKSGYDSPPPSLVKRQSQYTTYQENHGYLNDQNQYNKSSQEQYKTTYVQGSVVDDGNFILKSKTECCSRNRNQVEPSSPSSPGYVANIAKMWERRSRSKSPKPFYGLQTNV